MNNNNNNRIVVLLRRVRRNTGGGVCGPRRSMALRSRAHGRTVALARGAGGGAYDASECRSSQNRTRAPPVSPVPVVELFSSLYCISSHCRVDSRVFYFFVLYLFIFVKFTKISRASRFFKNFASLENIVFVLAGVCE